MPLKKSISSMCHGILDGEKETLSEKRETASVTAQQAENKKPLFETSDDWKLQDDVCVKTDGQVKNSPFAPHIAANKYRPDGVIWSDKAKNGTVD